MRTLTSLVSSVAPVRRDGLTHRAASLGVISVAAEPVVAPSPGRAVHRVRELGALREILEREASNAGTPRFLDLMGHTTRGAKLLRIGKTIIDMCDPKIDAFFVELAGQGLIEGAGIRSVRLLGCETAVEMTGQVTIRLLASRLRLPVYGTRTMLLRSHYNEHGFDPAFSHLLIESAQLPSPPETDSLPKDSCS